MFETHCYICTKPISINNLHESYSHFGLLIHGRVQSLSTLELGTQSTVKGEAVNGDVSNFVACAPQLSFLKLWQRYRLTRSNFGLLTFFLTCVNALKFLAVPLGSFMVGKTMTVLFSRAIAYRLVSFSYAVIASRESLACYHKRPAIFQGSAKVPSNPRWKLKKLKSWNQIRSKVMATLP